MSAVEEGHDSDAKSDKDESSLEERKKKVSGAFSKSIIPKIKSLPSSVWGFLLILVIGLFGFFIRIANVARLKLDWSFPFFHLEKVSTLIDFTTGKYIPVDLDAFLVLRYVKEVLANGMLSAHDALRYYPIGFDPRAEFTILTGFIAYLYKFISFFIPSASPELVTIMYPAIAYFLGIIFFYLAVKKLLGTKVALVASLLLSVLPSYLYRTVTGVNDKEAFSMFLLFLGFYLFVSAWKAKRSRYALLFGLGSGIITGLNGLVWGGVGFVYFIFGIFILLVILLDKFSEQDFFAYVGWFIPAVYIATMTPLSRTDIFSMATSTTSFLIFFALLMALIDFLVFKKDLLKIKAKVEKKLPLGAANFFISAIFIIVLASVIFGPSFIPTKVSDSIYDLFNPLQNRWARTVAESHEPYIVDWFSQMGNVFTLLLMVAVGVLYFDLFRSFDRKSRLIATLIYASLTLLFIFSRYSSSSKYLNGVSGIAKLLYLGPLIAFFLVAVFFYVYSYLKKKDLFHKFSEIDKGYIFVLVWFIIMVMGARRIVRLIFVFSSISSVLVAYILIRVYESSGKFDAYKDFWTKMGFFSLISLVIFLAVDQLLTLFGIIPGSFFEPRTKTLLILSGLLGLSVATILKEVKESKAKHIKLFFKISAVLLIAIISLELAGSTYSISKGLSSTYHTQWQAAGGWVRGNLSEDVVFAHWWDYGYWVQTGFERTAITDGGNAMGSWNHYMGRYLLTSQNDSETLEFLNSHGATHILFVSDEIGKYPAFSSIGADANYDRYSWINSFVLDPAQTKETRNQTVFVYTGGSVLDDEFVYNGKVFPAQVAGIAGFYVPFTRTEQGDIVTQPSALLVYNNQPTAVPLNCLYIAGRKLEFDAPEGLNGCLRVMPHAESQNGIGAALYLSPDVTKSLFARLYLFDEHATSPYYKLVYSDEENVPLALYPSGVHGPIRIWEVMYPENTPKNEAVYLSTEYVDPRVINL